jgi:hypothetical protein
MTDAIHHEKSSLREKIVEHVFIGDALREFWRSRIVDVEILRSEFDAFGYDLVLERGPITRHIQLKAGLNKPDRVGIAEALATKKSGCLIYIQISGELDLESFYWFGSEPNAPLPTLTRYPLRRKTTGARSPRQGHRTLPGTAFQGPFTLHQLLDKLLGSSRS